MSEQYQFILPFPPSANTYWRVQTMGKRVCQFISDRGKVFKDDVYKDFFVNGLADKKIKDRLEVKVLLFPPDRRKRDLDNYLKSTLDAITKAGFWCDDSQIDFISVKRAGVFKGGKLHVLVNVLRDLELVA